MTCRTLDPGKKLQEHTARTALAAAAGHDINDEEWEWDKAMLLEFVDERLAQGGAGGFEHSSAAWPGQAKLRPGGRQFPHAAKSPQGWMRA